MASHYEAPIRKPLVLGDKGYHDVSVDIAAPVEGRASRLWWIVFSIALAALLWGVGAIIYTISTGIGTWGLNKTVNWAWDITNFVWWVGIGHAGHRCIAACSCSPGAAFNGLLVLLSRFPQVNVHVD